MLGRVIFCVVIAAAVLAVVLLATVSPLPRRSSGAGRGGRGAPPGLRVLTVYIHPSTAPAAGAVRWPEEQGARAASALVFRHRMAAGPDGTARALGAASGFVLPGEGAGSRSAMSAFDTVHLEFDAAGLSGSICVEAARSKEAAPGHRRRRRREGDDEGEELPVRVLGGTGAFAFARGHGALGAAATATALRLRLELSQR